MEKIITETVNRFLANESNYDGEENNFEEYEQDYPNSEFNPDEIGYSELIDFVRSGTDFLYIINGNVACCNSNDIRAEILDELEGYPQIERTHKRDTTLWLKHRDIWDYSYVAIFKVKVSDNPYSGTYYIVYEEEK